MDDLYDICTYKDYICKNKVKLHYSIVFRQKLENILFLYFAPTFYLRACGRREMICRACAKSPVAELDPNKIYLT